MNYRERKSERRYNLSFARRKSTLDTRVRMKSADWRVIDTLATGHRVYARLFAARSCAEFRENRKPIRISIELRYVRDTVGFAAERDSIKCISYDSNAKSCSDCGRSTAGATTRPLQASCVRTESKRKNLRREIVPLETTTRILSSNPRCSRDIKKKKDTCRNVGSLIRKEDSNVKAVSRISTCNRLGS